MRKFGLGLVIGILLLAVFSGQCLADPPRVLTSQPSDGSKEVPTALPEIKIFFSQPMNTGSWSAFQVPGYEFPPTRPEGPPWQDPQTYVLKLHKLKPGTKYGLQLNSAKRKGFKSAKGEPLEPTAIRFSTAGQPATGQSGGGKTQPAPGPQPQPQPSPQPQPKKQPAPQPTPQPAPQPAPQPNPQPGGGGQGSKSEPLTDEDRIALHVMGGVMGVFFHELGHGLIEMLKLPITGREEDVVDEFSAMLLLYAREEGVDLIPEVIYGFADFFRLMAQYGGKTPWYDEHTPSMIRFGNIICLLYGSSPKEFQGLVERLKIPERRQYFCTKEYPQKRATWEKLLAPHLKENGAQGKGVMTVEYAPAKTQFGKMIQESLRKGRFFEQLAEGISTGIALPYDVTIVVGDCGQPNAFWDPKNKRIVVCHELIEFYVKLLEKRASGDKGRTPGGGGTTGGGRPGGGGAPGGGGQGQTQSDQRVVGLWGAESMYKNITFGFRLALDAQGNYHYQASQSNMGQTYYWEEEVGKYAADGKQIAFKVEQRSDGKGRGRMYRYPYMVNQQQFVLKRLPALKGKDLILRRLK
jgi:uncharacterized membrane protein YgcG